jgi:ribosome biogenesis protein BMS1
LPALPPCLCLLVLPVYPSAGLPVSLSTVGVPICTQKLYTPETKPHWRCSTHIVKPHAPWYANACNVPGAILLHAYTGVQGVADGGVRITFEDKPLLSDIVFLRAWVAVELPRLANPMTERLGRLEQPVHAAAVTRRNGAPAAAAAVAPLAAAAADGDDTANAAAAAAAAVTTQVHAVNVPQFEPSQTFAGPRPGAVFKRGALGVGYYADTGHAAAAGTGAAASTGAAAGFSPRAAAAATSAAGPPGNPAATSGWVPMRTVAELRREAGVGAPRTADSLYKPVERAPRTFNPLRVPTRLAAALPYKSKPKTVCVCVCVCVCVLVEGLGMVGEYISPGRLVWVWQ